MQANRMHRFFFAAFVVFPMLSASALMGPFLFSSFYMGGVLLFLFSCFWGFSGLYLALLSYLLLILDPITNFNVQALLFFGICTFSGFLAAALDESQEKLSFLEQQRLSSLLEKAREDLALAKEELSNLENERLLRELEENSDQKQLMALLQKAQHHSLELELEVKNLEGMITRLSLFPVGKTTKKKIKEEKGQGFFAFEF